jgi:hypothetical protein
MGECWLVVAWMRGWAFRAAFGARIKNTQTAKDALCLIKIHIVE